MLKIDCPEDYILPWGDLADARIYAHPELIEMKASRHYIRASRSFKRSCYCNVRTPCRYSRRYRAKAGYYKRHFPAHRRRKYLPYGSSHKTDLAVDR